MFPFHVSDCNIVNWEDPSEGNCHSITCPYMKNNVTETILELSNFFTARRMLAKEVIFIISVESSVCDIKMFNRYLLPHNPHEI